MNVDVHFLPALTAPEQLRGSCVIVVDILRATTTILHALAAGAREVIPCLEVSDARRRAQEITGPVLLGGERGGKRIDGFDLGNSPAEYDRPTVAGKSIVMTTTNGTRAMQVCSMADRVLIGGFVNLSPLLEAVRSAATLSILCAGTDGLITQEDVLFAGAVIHELKARGVELRDLNDEARLAVAAWSSSAGVDHGDAHQAESVLVALLRVSRGGRNLIELGYDRDIEWAARRDAAAVIGQLQLDSLRIHT